MSLIKNDIPILEYDTNSKAVIMPGHSTNFHFPERAVMLFMETEIDDYAMTNKCEIIGQFISITKDFPVYKTVHNGVELAICQAPLGGAASTQIMEQLIAGGVKCDSVLMLEMTIWLSKKALTALLGSIPKFV